MLESATVSFITVLTLLLSESAITDEIGNPWSVPVRSAQNEQAAPIPSVTVRVIPGRQRGQMGLNRTFDDPDNNDLPWEWVQSENSTVELHILAESDAQRLFLIDTIQSGVWFAWGTDYQGARQEAIIQKLLYQAGIVFKGFERLIVPDPDPTAPRPEGETFRAVVPLLCDIGFASTTQTVTAPPSGLTIGKTFVSDSGTPPEFTVTTPAVTYTPPH